MSFMKFFRMAFHKTSPGDHYLITGWPALLETPGTSWKWITLLEKPGKSKKLEKLEMLWIYFFSLHSSRCSSFIVIACTNICKCCSFNVHL